MNEKQIETLEKLAEQSKELHDFWFKTDNPNRPTRATRFDSLILQYDQGRFLARTGFWLVGGLIFLAANFERVQNFVLRR